MRIAKYRSWSELDKKFYYFLNSGYFKDNGEIAHQWQFNWENAEQCTVRKDKNDIELYSGDIYFDENNEAYYEIIFHKEYLGFFCITKNESVWSENIVAPLYNQIVEKIGTIHENFELMEK